MIAHFVFQKFNIIPDEVSLTDHYQNIFDDLYERLITKYIQDKDEYKSDAFVWKNIYKNHFEKYGLSSKLQNHSIKTKRDEIDFDKSWKNGVWNCYQPISFTLKNPESIKNKVYKWSGIIQELSSSKEEISLYLLSSLPKIHSKDLIDLIRDTFEEKDFSNLKVHLVEQAQAEEFAHTVKKQMEKSGLIK